MNNALPSIEQYLLLALDCFGVSKFTSHQKKKFATTSTEFKKYTGQLHAVIDDLITELLGSSHDQSSVNLKTDIIGFLLYQFNLKKRVWTGEADSKYVLWQLLTHSYIPGLARAAAIWQLEEGPEEGMPGGRFWFLPQVNTTKQELTLPMEHVILWLQELLGQKFENLDSSSRDTESVIREIYNWKKGTIPHIRNLERFVDDIFNSKEAFKGTFNFDRSQPLNSEFEKALNLVKSKGYSATEFIHEIPITTSSTLMEDIFAGSVSKKIKKKFVIQVSKRFSMPSKELVARRLKQARACQYIYVELLKFFFPDVKPLNSNPVENKLVQCINLFTYVYNLSVGSARKAKGDLQKEAKTFESSISHVYKYTLLSGLSSIHGNKSYEHLAEYLTVMFLHSKSNELNDFFLLSEQGKPIIQEHASKLKLYEEIISSNNAIDQKVSQGEELDFNKIQMGFGEICKLLSELNAPEKYVVQLEQEINTDKDALYLDFLKLDHIFKKESYSETDSHLAEQIYQRLKTRELPIDISPHVLVLMGRHELNKGNNESAIKHFKRAFEQAELSNYGDYRGYIGKALLATLLETEKFNLNNHEKYLKAMLATGWLELTDELGVLSCLIFKEALLWNANANDKYIIEGMKSFFNDSLYKPYLSELIV